MYTGRLKPRSSRWTPDGGAGGAKAGAAIGAVVAISIILGAHVTEVVVIRRMRLTTRRGLFATYGAGLRAMGRTGFAAMAIYGL